ncbi:sugar phosphate isomerase/epimerase [Clostridia bacterium OttesenSCG-928-F22]|nr:sugar phosphate isomerase/epimerase [Clostridia bacterium OttesenSCG-928-F22]
MMTNKIGIYANYWPPSFIKDDEEQIARVANAGYDVAELVAFRFLDSPKSRWEKIRELGEKYNVGFSVLAGPSLEDDPLSEDPAARKRGLEFIKKSLDFANVIGATTIAGVNYGAWLARPPVDWDFDKRPYFDRCVAFLKEACKPAEDYGIGYSMEILNRFEHFLMNTAAEGLEVCKAVGSPVVKLHLDSYHMNIEEDNFYDAIIASKGYIGHYQVGESNRRLPGVGHIPWDEIFRALKDVDFQGIISAEPFIRLDTPSTYKVALWRDLSNNANSEDLDNEAKRGLKFIKDVMSRY